MAKAEQRVLEPGTVVRHRGDRIEEVDFPIRGAISEIEEGLDGGSTEVTAVGPEGFCGLEALLDLPICSLLRITEINTTVICIPLKALMDERDRSSEFHRLVHRYAAARLVVLAISVGCNARHDALSRLARWLLLLNDRVGHDNFELTHETIARMIGVRRATITRSIADLVAGGAIASARSTVRIVDRSRLEAMCCSCYVSARDLYDALYRADDYGFTSRVVR